MNNSSTLSVEPCRREGILTLRDAFEFIKNGKLFKKWTDDEIKTCIVNCYEDGSLFWSSSGRQLTGVLLARIDRKKKTVHVIGVEGKLRPFIETYKRAFSGYKLTGTRHGKLVEYRL